MKQNKQRHIIAACCWSICLALLIGCSSGEDLPFDNGNHTEEVTESEVSISFQISTKANVPDGNDELITYPDNNLAGTQHASEVFLLIFQGIGPDAVFTGYAKNIGWKEHFADKLPNHTAEMEYVIKNQFVTGEKYTLMGVGFNASTDAAFGFPTSLEKGVSLQEAIVSLSNTKSVHDIRSSEIYVGTKEFEAVSNSIGKTKVTLYRRVAGIMGYFTNVPHRLSSGGLPVTNLRISLYTAQNISVPLMKRQQKPYFEDYIQSPSMASEASVIVDIKVPDDVKKETVLSGGSYVLPVPGPTSKDKYTLVVELMNQTQTEPLKRIRVKLGKGDEMDGGQTGGGTGIIDTESAYRFPIVANHFYGIGAPDKAIDINGHGDEVLIYIDPSWREENDLNVSE